MARHGTRRGYKDGCRCDDCRDAQRLYQQRYRERHRSQVTRRSDPLVSDEVATTPGLVESGVQAEIAGLAEARPGLAQVALALARVLDNPKAISQKPAAAKVLVGLLDKLIAASARGRRGGLVVVRAMSTRDLGT